MAYQDDIAELKRQRAQAEQAARAEAEWRQNYQAEDWQEHVQSVADEYNESIANRDEALASGDGETAKYWDRNAVRLHTEYNQLNPPPPPPPHRDQVELFQKNRPYLEKYGQRAAQRTGEWDQYWTRRGVPPGHPDYKDRMRDALELYGKNDNMPYDRKDELPLPNEVPASAKSPLTAEQYNRGLAAARRDGKIR
jgi:hypothetical protein